MNQTYNRFMVHYALFIGTPDSFHIEVKNANSAVRRITIKALNSRDIFNNYWRRYSSFNDAKKKHENPIAFNFIDAKTSYLRLSDFHTGIWSKYNYSYSTEYRTFFEKLAKNGAEHLIIDLRNNEGGNPAIGIGLLQYVCTAAFRPYDFHEVKHYKFDSLRKYFRNSSEFPSYPDELFNATGNGTFRSNNQYKTETWSRIMQPSPTAFHGKIYVLLNGATGSAAAILATLIKVNCKNAVFIGEECGGVMEGPISGNGTDILLPNTKVRVDIPFIKRVINLNGHKMEHGRGVIPDYSVEFTAADLLNNVDTQKEFVLRHIGKN